MALVETQTATQVGLYIKISKHLADVAVGNTWDTTFCPDGKTCAENCALDGELSARIADQDLFAPPGADYSGTYGISSSGAALTLKFVTGSNVGSRVYLLAPGSTTEYQTFNFENQEFVSRSCSFRLSAAKLLLSF